MPVANPPFPFNGFWSIDTSAMANVSAAVRAWRPSVADMKAAAGTIEARDRGFDDIMSIAGGVAVINVLGPIEKRETLLGYWFGFASSVRVRKALAAAVGDEDVRQIVLRFDSPGGTVDGLSDLGDAVFKARDSKPITAQVDGLAASAAYYVAAQASTIVAGRTDLVGSIGTKLVLWDMSAAFDDAGIKVVAIDTGEFKSAGEPGTEITDEQIADFRRLVDAFFADFVEAVARGRGMEKSAVRAVADGRVFTGPEARKLGLVDRVGSFDETIARAGGGSRPRRARAAASLVGVVGG